MIEEQATVPAAQVTMSWAGTVRGARDLLAPSVSVVALGFGFGIAARAAGMDTALAGAMSGLVFAGGSQFAALELWGAPMPWTALVITTLAVNARHILYGATLHAWFGKLPRLRRYLAVSLLSDLNWAASCQAYEAGERDAGHLLGGGAMMWLSWLAGTFAGAVIGEEIGDLQRWGVDVILPAFFACSLIGLARNRSDVIPWVTAAIVALIAANVLPSNWYVLVGTAAGGLTGALLDARR